ncbi:phosphogluconate dehydratase [Pseudobacteriovorax antillogorgiicola]|uniref:Phosphogluconate dehydratase n=1 Tax=Pseudobacteriovorax antillogorgiicola TaxID=1513793 RepID=A0A1Y6BHM8_9BACT|nr:phosphogluconate dehydratase [Pseudobacteriovorax antillogorgiicola]TCS55578.1 6-phosphogluconate dehydratase [Pseudobacteriovorax antillogorgiicola]SMF10669.1 6-phosphogluconate dehydratase [Pseudobacteriovorax antillogorgiicola]
MNATLKKILDRVKQRSAATREAYEARMVAASQDGPNRKVLSCGNLAHGFAACGKEDKAALAGSKVNVAIVSAYNDMLSAHQPFQSFPEVIKEALQDAGGVAQFAGGVPAMCDGVTQGQPGMELSLFSRDNIAMATGVALSHNMFDAAVCLGVCDKIVPGMLMGALSFGHLPVIFLPAGPMESGLPNKEKARIRELYAKGEIGRDELLECESKSYHSPGTCTFYGTANSNQMLMEFMGLHLPGTSFVNPGTEMRHALTYHGAQLIASQTQLGKDYKPLYKVITAEAIINGIIGLLATGGSTNHTLHIIAIAKAAGIEVNWDDMAELSEIIPLLARVYPNGAADVNHFHAAGGLGYIIGQLLDGGLLCNDVETVFGSGLEDYAKEPQLVEGNKVQWSQGTKASLDREIVSPLAEPFSQHGGIMLMEGNLGRSVVKTSAVAEEHLVIEAPAVVFESQAAMQDAFKAGELHKDCIVVVRFQGPKANGMPELHKLTPPLGVLQTLGHKVALITDGRMSGASGKVPAAIHLWPEALDQGPIGKIQNGDMIRFDAKSGELNVLVEPSEWARRTQAERQFRSDFGMGRELFSVFRDQVSSAEQGASVFFKVES